MKIEDVEHATVDIDASREHAYNQVNVRRLESGDKHTDDDRPIQYIAQTRFRVAD